MKLMQKSICALAVLAATATSFSAQAAGTVDLKVIGTITPSACVPTITGGSVFDYGTIKADTLNATDYTQLSPKFTTFSIACDSPTLAAVKATNLRLNSLAGATEVASTGAAQAPVWNGYYSAGLGMDGQHKIGGYTIYQRSSITADGNAGTVIYSDDNKGSWHTERQPSLFGIGASPRLLTVAATGTTTPLAFTNLTFGLGVQAYINKKSELDLTKDITMDGMTTLEVVYL
ncbi:DUF1120 domain-containing protein [Cedecea neteri]|uniref:DUF1120 domain-containing protein n=1 Tax=Cedecea neteri TaxID=158822 RepID=UPI00289316BB|nr:DUF1120 domain-containing protein [Cedecea neteri]WNJ78479.1 DUF1120 domain-containing protein [Cedecea neteri]